MCLVKQSLLPLCFPLLAASSQRLRLLVNHSASLHRWQMPFKLLVGERTLQQIVVRLGCGVAAPRSGDRGATVSARHLAFQPRVTLGIVWPITQCLRGLCCHARVQTSSSNSGFTIPGVVQTAFFPQRKNREKRETEVELGDGEKKG